MDLGLSPDPMESYRLFQARIQQEYERIVAEYGLASMDATQPVEIQQRALRDLVRPHLTGIARDPSGDAPEINEGRRA
jgi:dTMP kinase